MSYTLRHCTKLMVQHAGDESTYPSCPIEFRIVRLSDNNPHFYYTILLCASLIQLLYALHCSLGAIKITNPQDFSGDTIPVARSVRSDVCIHNI